MTNLIGLHDAEAQTIAAPDTWILHTVALSENPAPAHLNPQFHWITRLNWGYGNTGTLPTPEHYADFAAGAARFVASSTGCTRWIIGNETNLPREWPQGKPIYPWNYAECFRRCRDVIQRLPGHADDEILVAGSGPWNIELKYEGNPTGDWITYFADVLSILNGGYSGFALHAYTHGYDPALVTSNAKMDAPFQDRHYHFRTYRDYCAAIHASFRHLPAYITEANGDGPWQATGLMPAMLEEIRTWNWTGAGPQIQCVIMYRYPRYDQFYIEGRADVLAEYRAAAQRGFTSPGSSIPPPVIIVPPPPDAPANRQIDASLLARGVEFDFVTPPAGTGYWRIVKADWLNAEEADDVGPDHHILGTVVRNGRPAADVRLKVSWPTGSTQVVSKAPQPNVGYNFDFPMSASLNEFAIRVDDGAPSDSVSEIGMGAQGNPGLHTSTWIDFAWTIAAPEGFPIQPPALPVPPVDIPQPPVLLPTAKLAHPLPGATISQNMYQNPKDYARYDMPGHNGTDFGGKPAGTPVCALADGVVAFVGTDAAYGNYCRVSMTGLGAYAFFAHMTEVQVSVGQRLQAGDVVGTVGWTGNVKPPGPGGAHLHLEIRLCNPDGSYKEGTPMRNGRVDPRTWAAMHGLTL